MVELLFLKSNQLYWKPPH